MPRITIGDEALKAAAQLPNLKLIQLRANGNVTDDAIQAIKSDHKDIIISR